jgi:hypothetical protein
MEPHQNHRAVIFSLITCADAKATQLYLNEERTQAVPRFLQMHQIAGCREQSGAR